MEKATFAAGCFWGVEDSFVNLKGVITVTSGYTGGHLNQPTYELVCTGATGHAEAVEIVFDENQISFEQLLHHLFQIHNPTTLNKQGPDIGTQYRSAIFFHNEQQKQIAEKFLAQQASNFNNSIVTQLLPADVFWPAEEYHQKWCKKHPRK